jgi:hypothetical protein
MFSFDMSTVLFGFKVATVLKRAKDFSSEMARRVDRIEYPSLLLSLP